MPTYEYECQKCQHRFDLFQSIKAAPLKTCPKCKGKVQRLIGGGSGIIFKGSGFYENDYKKKRSSADTKKDSGDNQKKPSCPNSGSCGGCGK